MRAKASFLLLALHSVMILGCLLIRISHVWKQGAIDELESWDVHPVQLPNTGCEIYEDLDIVGLDIPGFSIKLN